MNLKIFYRLACLFILCGLCQHVIAQNEHVKSRLRTIYRNYDSIPYLSFDVRYTYTSDTVAGRSDHDVVVGSYTMSGKKAKFRMGEVEYMQNDSIFIAIYQKDQMMIVADPKSNAGGHLPMRVILDSAVNSVSEEYEIQVSENEGDSIHSISFIARTDSAVFERFTLHYAVDKGVILRLEYLFGQPEAQPDSTGQIPEHPEVIRRHKKLQIDFFNYRLDNYQGDLYDESKYVWYENGELKPTSAYKEYRVYNTRQR